VTDDPAGTDMVPRRDGDEAAGDDAEGRVGCEARGVPMVPPPPPRLRWGIATVVAPTVSTAAIAIVRVS